MNEDVQDAYLAILLGRKICPVEQRFRHISTRARKVVSRAYHRDTSGALFPDWLKKQSTRNWHGEPNCGQQTAQEIGRLFFDEIYGELV